MPLSPKSAALFISQSGETADTLASLRYCRKAGVPIGAIVNVRESTIARESDVVFPTLAGPGDRRRLDQGLHLPALGAGRARRPCRPARAARSRRRRRRRSCAALSEAPRFASQVLKLDEQIESVARELVALQARALSRPRHQLSAGHGRRAEAQGNLLYPRRRLCGGRTEARADRADRREHAGHRHRAA